MRIAYLGPPGTFTEEALRRLPVSAEADLIPVPSIQDVLLAVEKGDVDKGIVPVENSIEGTVNVTTDMLIFEVELRIEFEMVLPVDHNILVRPGTGLSQVDKVYSNPHATAQCRRFLSERVPQAVSVATNSTADAARIVAEEDPRGAAIATKLAAEIYGLTIAAPDIQDVKANETRFILVGPSTTERPAADVPATERPATELSATPVGPAPSRSTGQDKTSIVCFIHEDRPGSLLEILQQFARRGINLTKVESRPTKQRLGEYCFLIDLEGHIADPKVQGAFAELQELIPHIKILGSYPRWSA